jgi:gluconokinase
VWDALHTAVPGIREIVASGGAFAHLPAWLQIVADVFGCDIVRSTEDEGSSRGAALLALEALGAVRIEAMPVPRGPEVRADAARHAVYEEAIARHLRAERLLEPPGAVPGGRRDDAAE